MLKFFLIFSFLFFSLFADTTVLHKPDGCPSVGTTFDWWDGNHFVSYTMVSFSSVHDSSNNYWGTVLKGPDESKITDPSYVVCQAGSYKVRNVTCVLTSSIAPPPSNSDCPGVNNMLLSDGNCTNATSGDYMQDAQTNCESIGSTLKYAPYISTIVTIDNIEYDSNIMTCINGISFISYQERSNIVLADNNFTGDIQDDNLSFTPTQNNLDDNSSVGVVGRTNVDAINNVSLTIIKQTDKMIAQNTNFLGQKLDNLGLIQSSTNSKLSSIDSSLKAVNNNNNLINSNLQSLKSVNQNGFDSLGNKIDGLKDTISGDSFMGDLGFGSITDFYNNVQTDLSTITEQFDNYISIYENGFSESDFSLPSGVDPSFTSTAFGKTINIDLCPSFSIFKPILYLIFSFVFLFLSVRIFWLGIKFNQGSN
ncbi:MAG: hypothetical protein QM482_09150 [Sulfurospirillum sp.]